ncbi:evolutionarily conserved C-terminal region 2 [Rhynchospora pubera]|uniref:YTH domain-containing family protein n=1 Tax=Rhynchospora pubera TaxID=906938 RepID=A0AAV8DLW2_9POAL|nr:evolutionarily conserved C-terminal region 2 [Rhynchospora pubera]
MGSEGAPDYLYGAGLYYQNGTNYNWYDPTTGLTGTQATPKWDDFQPIVGFEGPDLQYQSVQADNSPCLYYSPEYGYTQPGYDPYLASSYQLGSVVGPENSLVGNQVSQHYLTNPQYQHPQPVPSPSFPSIVLPNGTDFGSVTTPSYQHGSIETLNCGNYMNPAATQASAILPVQKASPGTITVTGTPLSSSSLEFQSVLKAPKAPALGLSSLKQSPQKTVKAGTAPHVTQVTNPSALVKPISHDKSTRPGHVESENRNWGRVRAFWDKSTITVKSYTSRLLTGDSQGNIIIDINNYNKADFPTDYSCAKFFVIKSYSEDDVHKSIKYGVWSSTPNGNKKLSSAYEDAQRISVNNGVKCPIFLFFSVNTSGHFCGVAEMVGPVDFDKSMDIWQQDKWPGSFPVKWHIIKDVANNTLRHIQLENNECKPVTHSRDTQEVAFTPGIEILKIFKNHALINSILDGFLKFEEQERNNRRKCTKLLSSDAPIFVPAFIRKQAVGLKVPQSATEKKQDKKSTSDWSSIVEATLSEVKSEGYKEYVPVKMCQEISVNNPNLVVKDSPVEKAVAMKKEAHKAENCTVFKEKIKACENGNPNFQPENAVKQANPVIKTKYKPVENGKNQPKPLDQIENMAEKIGSLSIKSNDENGRIGGGGDVVTIGSMHVRVNSLNEK